MASIAPSSAPSQAPADKAPREPGRGPAGQLSPRRDGAEPVQRQTEPGPSAATSRPRSPADRPRSPSSLTVPGPPSGDLTRAGASAGLISVGSVGSQEEQEAEKALREQLGKISYRSNRTLHPIVRPDESCYFDHVAVTLQPSKLQQEKDAQRWMELAKKRTLRGFCCRLASTPYFRAFFSMALFVDLFLLAVEVNVSVEIEEDPQHQARRMFRFFVMADHFFTVIFLVEIIIRILGCVTWRDNWLLMEGAIVALSVLEIWVLALIFPGKSGSKLPTFAAFRSIRFVRGLRAVRALKVFRYVKQLRLMAESVYDAFLGILWIMVLVTTATWCLAIMLVQGVNPWQVHGWEVPEDWQDIEVQNAHVSQSLPHMVFEHVGSSLFVLQLLLVNGLDWGPRMIEPLMFSPHLIYGLMCMFIMAFILAVCAYVLPLIKATFISTLLRAAERDEMLSWQSSFMKGTVCVAELKKIFYRLDKHEIGCVDRHDWVQCEEEVQEFLQAFKLNPEAARNVFRLLDANRSGVISMDEFIINSLFYLRGQKTRQVVCMDWMSRKLQAALHKLKFTTHYQLEGALARCTEVEKSLDRAADRASSLFAKLDKGVILSAIPEILPSPVSASPEDSFATGRLVTPPQRQTSGSQPRGIMLDLDERFSFSARLERLGEELRRHEEARGSLEQAEQSFWRQLLAEEAMPFLQRHRAALDGVEVPPLNAAAAEQRPAADEQKAAAAEQRPAAAEPAAAAQKPAAEAAVRPAAAQPADAPAPKAKAKAKAKEEEVPEAQPLGWGGLPLGLLTAVKGGWGGGSGLPGFAEAPPHQMATLFTPARGDLGFASPQRGGPDLQI